MECSVKHLVGLRTTKVRNSIRFADSGVTTVTLNCRPAPAPAPARVAARSFLSCLRHTANSNMAHSTRGPGNLLARKADRHTSLDETCRFLSLKSKFSERKKSHCVTEAPPYEEDKGKRGHITLFQNCSFASNLVAVRFRNSFQPTPFHSYAPRQIIRHS